MTNVIPPVVYCIMKEGRVVRVLMGWFDGAVCVLMGRCVYCSSDRHLLVVLYNNSRCERLSFSRANRSS